jgi:glutamate:GABA antiporter
MLYLIIPSINAAYWILSAMTVLLLCTVYLFVFAALIKLRYSQPDTHRAFKIPGGISGIWV